jgi:hypothetical protein
MYGDGIEIYSFLKFLDIKISHFDFIETVIPTLTQGYIPEVGMLTKKQQKRVKDAETRFVRNVTGHTSRDQITNTRFMVYLTMLSVAQIRAYNVEY